MIDFDNENFISYKTQLKDNFMFFRMFLADDVDAIITYFISTGEISYTDLSKIYEGLYQALVQLMAAYPNKTAKSLDSILKLPKGKNINTCDTFNYHIVFRLSQVLMHLLAETSYILSGIDPDAP